MFVYRARYLALRGLDGDLAAIQAHLDPHPANGGVTGISRDTRDRVRAALRNATLPWPASPPACVVLRADRTLEPADDLAVAVAVLATTGDLLPDRLADTVLVGELTLDGRLRPVPGVLARVLAARAHGVATVLVPVGNLAELTGVTGIAVWAARDLTEVAAWLRGQPAPLIPPLSLREGPAANPATVTPVVPEWALRALEAAAAGGHHTLLTGTTGSAVRQIGLWLHSLLPPLPAEQAWQVAALHSLAEVSDRPVFRRRAPFAAPHHTASLTALLGGGRPPRPGAVSRAHAGLLLLAEAAAFGSDRLDALCPVLDHRSVPVDQDGQTVSLPAGGQVVLAAGTCPCGALDAARCVCTPAHRRRHAQQVPARLLDRLDVRVHLDPTPLRGRGDLASTAAIRERVHTARERAARRWRAHGWRTNAEVPAHALRTSFALPADTLLRLELAQQAGTMTDRAALGCLRLAWTFADLDGADVPTRRHVAHAINTRTTPPIVLPARPNQPPADTDH